MSSFLVLDMNKIHENLYQGAAPPMGDFLKSKGFDVLVLSAKEWQDSASYSDIHVICAPGDDDERVHRMERFLPAWKQAALEVATHIKAGKKVLVTCMQGLNRSGMVTAIALHHLTGWSGKTIVEHIQSRRQDALFNRTFVAYLEEQLQPFDLDVDTTKQ